MKKLKLYVWENVLINYTDGIMFALAENADHARKLICEYVGVKEDNTNSTVVEDLKSQPKVYDAPVGYAVWGGA